MSDKGNTLLIILATAIILLGAFFTYFEIVSIPDVEWSKKYSYESDNPYDASLFYKLMKNKFGSDNIILRKNGFNFKDNADTSTLYIFLGNKSYFKNTTKDSLIRYASQGNRVLLIASTARFFKPNPEDFNDSSEFQNVLEEEEEEEEEEDTSSIPIESDSISNTEDNSNHIVSKYYTDSSIFIKYINNDTSQYIYKNYNQNFDVAKLHTFAYMDLKDSTLLEPYITNGFDKMWFGKYKEIPNIDLHFVPELFSNAAARQSSYLSHLNFVFDRYDITKVVLDNPSMQVDYVSDKGKSPLTYIINTSSLKWAYYITILTFLIFITNGGKRKQKVIPIKEQPKNTSLEYIKMISKLYEEQDQNEKLVLHMRKNFAHYINKKYFVEIENINVLSKKSGIDKKAIERILSKFESAEKSDFSDEQLYVLHQQIESFIKNSK